MSRNPRAPAHGLVFTPGNHSYRLDGNPVPGVTTILGVLDKPAIPKWAAKMVAEYVNDNYDAVETLRSAGGNALVNTLKDVPWVRRDKAAGRGTDLHDVLERLLEDEDVDVPDDYVPVIENALDFLEAWKIKPWLTEAAVGSREHRYAGKLDMIASYTRPDTGHTGVGIFDWKSGKAIYPEYAWQLSAYAFAEFCGERGDEGVLPACDAAFGVQIRADATDVVPLAFGPDVFAEFLSIRRTYDIVKRGRGDWRQAGSGHVGITIRSDPAA